MASFLLQLTLLCLCFQTVYLDTRTYYFQDSCFDDIHYVEDDDTFYVEWDGSNVYESFCGIEFHGHDMELYDEYKICIDVEKFYISSNDCGIQLSYQDGLTSTNFKEYGCYSYPTRWCSESDAYVDIVLSGADRSTSGNSNIKLKITAKRADNYLTKVYVSVGGAVGGMVLLILVLTVTVICIRRRRAARQHQPLLQSPSVPYQSINTSGYNTYPTSYGVENPALVQNYPTPNGHNNGLPYGYQGALPGTPPPPYAISKPATPSANDK